MISKNHEIDIWVTNHQNELLQFLSRLVQIPSEVCPPVGNELACQKFVEKEFEKQGAVVDVFTPDDVPGLREHPAFFGTWDGMPRSFENRPDVVGLFRGVGGGKSIIISTHVDTVPHNPELWKESTPLSGEIKNGRLYGRGAWDTKWGIAAGVFAIRCIQELNIQLKGDVILESIADEEYAGSHGTLASRLRGYNADVAINCEPTNMIVAAAHHGGTAWRITVRGDAGMAFGDKKQVNPVYKLARLIEAIKTFEIERNKEKNTVKYYETTAELPAYTLQIGGGGDSYAEAEGIPSDCYLIIWVEELPGTDFETHKKRLIGFINDYLSKDSDFDGVFPEYSQLVRYIPGTVIDESHRIFEHLESSFLSTNCTYKVGGASFACDTYVFNKYSSTPAMTLGPGGANAHGGDEYVNTEDVISLTKIFAKVMVSWCL